MRIKFPSQNVAQKPRLIKTYLPKQEQCSDKKKGAFFNYSLIYNVNTTLN